MSAERKGREVTNMKQKQWIRVAKFQLLITGLFVMLLGVAVSILTIVTHCANHFTVISSVTSEANVYRIIHRTVFFSGICLSTILVLSALLSTAALVRESECLMAMVEDTMIDVYDFIYDEYLRNFSETRRQELMAIHHTFQCCGKISWFKHEKNSDQEMCPLNTSDGREDCLQAMEGFLKKHMSFVSGLLLITLPFMVCGMVLTSFLFFSIHFGITWNRKGKYTLTPQ
ncbi:tetraspanin-32 isoform X2 [Rhinatrema bivittatum]|uniref:tetraspanin-32 isoform X2 n=1 Tax=Rhinatrema bivittatum TaxID=194408 RepID=UPI0011278A7B|nr:tetraspanin-32 isoform X2 [Rhinatrema bivittatum]